MKMYLHWFANVVVHHPFAIILSVTVFSGTCLIIPFATRKSFPSFADPQMGFSTRGTSISNRLTTWENLVESTKPSGEFTVNPKELLFNRKQALAKSKEKKTPKKKKNRKKDSPNILINKVRNSSESSFENFRKFFLKELRNPSVKPSEIVHFEPDGFFCGYPDQKYAHIVIKSMNNKSLFNLKSLLTMCRLEHEFTEARYFTDLCIENTKTNKCCRPWSLANYIAILHNRTSCLGINEEDITSTIALLKKCSSYYFNLELLPDCSEKIHCEAPRECIKYDAIYNIFNFLTTTTFISDNDTSLEAINLFETMLFLPIAASTAILPYFYTIEKLQLEYNEIKVVAMDFGIKSSLFDECLVHDAWLMAAGSLFILFCIWLYTESLFLTVMTIIAIIFSLGISYFMYQLVFEFNFFPFMNLLAIIVAIGIGADDAFIFCKIWDRMKVEKDSSMVKLLSETFYHAFTSMFVTTLTTTVAFLASYISSVTAICCFGVFAGTAVLANYLLMLTWFPACVVVWEQYCCSSTDLSKTCLIACLHKGYCSKMFIPNLSILNTWPKCSTISKLWQSKEKYLLDCVVNLKYLWIVLFTGFAFGGAFIVFYYPKLKLPDSQDFQLFASTHPFEQYDFVYKNHFWFHRESLNTDSNTNYQLPLRFVWGVLPVDNGDHLDPTSLGKLQLDPDFSISAPESQQWLLHFCRQLRKQPFFQPMLGSFYPNCFIETFMKSMQRTCTDYMTGEDRSPCCKSSSFPFNASIFDECIIQEIADIYETPNQYLLPGVAGPKFSKDQSPTIKAVVVEYNSNYSYSMSYEPMHEFYTMVEEWTTEQLKSAPKAMKNGWFVSELKFYDLQKELAMNTFCGILLSMGLALIVLIFSTLNLLTSFYAILTITFSIFVSISVLVLLGWKLNILESVAISTAIGLTVDFSLHYATCYRMCPIGLAGSREAATRYALSSMAGPALMAAITTGASGAFMMPSLILPYIQIGIFLVIVMSVSWMYATFFLGSLLATIGPQNHFGQFAYARLFCFRWGSKTSSSERNHPAASSVSDSHELDSLTNKSFTAASKSTQQSYSGGKGNKNMNRYMFSEQSPSATSAITIIMADDN